MNILWSKYMVKPIKARKAAALVIMCVLYALVQYLILKVVRNQAAMMLGAVPILLASWWWSGYKWTIVAGLCVAAIQPFIYKAIFRNTTPVVFVSGTSVTLFMTFLGVLLARMKELTGTVNAQIALMKKAELEKVELQEQLFQSQKMEALGQLAGGIAHDFNNILGAITGYSELIFLQYSHSDEKLGKYVSAIHDASQRGGEMTANLLAFARKKRFELLPVDLHTLIRNLVELLQHTIDKKIVVSHHLKATGCIVVGDSTQLQNSLLNIALNARDAMPDGGELTIHTENIDINDQFAATRSFQIQRGQYLLIQVRDTGMGMDTATMKRAFEPFFTTKGLGKGTGLGLSIVFGTVKGHGGFIEIDSSPGNGCRVNIYLPVSTSPPFAKSMVEDVLEGNGTILVIDDDEAIRDVMYEILHGLGYTVITCKDGDEGVGYFRGHYKEIDLIVLDIIMSGMSGYDCFNALMDIDNSKKVIIASGYSSENEIEKLSKLGVTDFIKKPFSRKTLSDTVKKCIVN